MQIFSILFFAVYMIISIRDLIRFHKKDKQWKLENNERKKYTNIPPKERFTKSWDEICKLYNIDSKLFDGSKYH